jgi:hypothetical protein
MMKTKRQSRLEELEAAFEKAVRVADCSITHADADSAKYWLKECEEYAALVWAEDGLLPDNCTAYCKVKSRAMTALEECE